MIEMVLATDLAKNQGNKGKKRAREWERKKVVSEYIRTSKKYINRTMIRANEENKKF